jgi:hypothetical protein
MLTLPEIADAFAVDVSTVRGWVRRGLPAFRVGRVLRVASADLERWRRLNTWAVEVGVRALSAGEPSTAATRVTSTGGPSSASEPTSLADAFARNTRLGRRRPPAHGSARRSLAPIVELRSAETA